MANKFTPELFEKAKKAKTPEKLATLAKENGIELTAEEANTYFAVLNPQDGELADDELDQVAGGRKCGTIYKDGCPVVSPLNSCEYFTDKETMKESPNDGYCCNCHYVTGDSSGLLMLCDHEDRYNN